MNDGKLQMADGKAGRRFWLSIFLPCGITWECGEGIIRTRNTRTGAIRMRAHKCSGPAESWLAAARALTENRRAWLEQAAKHPESTMADGRWQMGQRVRVYSGPHYGHVHIVEGRSESLVHVNYRRDRFAVPHCDLEAA